MIYVTQGHEKGVGLEIFLKAFICLPSKNTSSIVLITQRKALEKTLISLKVNYEIINDLLHINYKKLKLQFICENDYLSTHALIEGIKSCKKEDLLLTLPTSKDQIINLKDTSKFNGHTDFFRDYFKDYSITMNFISPRLNVLLLSDHIELSKVYEALKVEDILLKFKSTLNNLKKFRNIKRIHLAGVNPHCGEGGIISKFDDNLKDLPSKLRSIYQKCEVFNFVPADTIMFNDFTNEDLIVFPYHDQGLIPFKQENGFIGINLTLGLPFIRMSVDHGTAFDLFGKNKANYQGMLYLLSEALKNPAFAGL